MAVPVLQLRGLDFAWAATRLFQGLDHALGPGITWLTGDEATGKTTLLRLIAGELPAQAGSLHVQGVPLHGQPQAYRERVFWCDPRDPRHDDVPARDWLATLAGQAPAFDAGAQAALIEGLGLAPHLDKRLSMLSTGSRRKLGLCAALTAGAPLTLIDQPFAALDPPSIRCVVDALAERADDPARSWLLADHAPHPALMHHTVWSLDAART